MPADAYGGRINANVPMGIAYPASEAALRGPTQPLPYTPSTGVGAGIPPNTFAGPAPQMRRTLPKEKEPAKFDGKGDLMDYLSYFMKIVRLNGWDYTTSGLQLGTSLVGNAAAVLSTLSMQQSDDLRCLVQALLAEHCPMGWEAQYSFELMTRSKKDKESMNDFAEALVKLARKSYPSIGVPDRILIDLFKRGCLAKIRSYRYI
jgi:hypothetical protein